MLPDWRYWRFYYTNRLLDTRQKYRTYGWKAWLPHRHLPRPIPAADGFYCDQCGTRRAIVQIRATQEVL